MSHEPLTYHPLPEDPCLTEAQLCGYIDGALTPKEQHQVEKHLLDCAMCSDALEGFMLVKNRDKAAFVPVLPGEEATQNESPQEKKDEKEKGKVFFLFGPGAGRYAAAAALILFVGVAWFLKGLVGGDQEKTMSDNRAADSYAHDSVMKMDSIAAANEKPTFTPLPAPPREEAAADAKEPLAAADKAAERARPDQEQSEEIAFADETAPVAGEAENRDQSTHWDFGDGAKENKNVDVEADKKPANPKQLFETAVQKKEESGDKDAGRKEKEKLAQESQQYKQLEKNKSGKLFDNKLRTKSLSDSYGFISPAPKADSNKMSFSTGNDTYRVMTDSMSVTNSNSVVNTTISSQNTVNLNAAEKTMSYTWSDGATTGGTAAPPAGTYSVTVTDANGASTESSANSPAKPARTYEEGMEMTKGNRNAEAIAVFDAILADPKHPKYEDAQWQKAVALVKLNRKAEAKTLLNTIIRKNGKYKALAESQLKQL